MFDQPVDRKAATSYLIDSRHHIWLAYRGSRGVGFLRAVELLQLHTTRRQMFLYEVAVRPSAQRHGVGRALVSALLRFCREKDFEEVFVFTDDPSNAEAHALYRATGAVTETPGDRMYVYRLSPSPHGK
ncbi:MAG: GNAT family N-acetyltransferase [Thermoplasmata archaeon]